MSDGPDDDHWSYYDEGWPERAPTKPAPDPRAWRVATALARETLPKTADRWPDWADGLTAALPTTPGPDCDACGGWGGFTDHVSDQWYTCPYGCLSPKRRAQVPVPAPWDAAAYLADCARRGVEPGPLPSLEWTGDDGFGWSVTVIDGRLTCVAFTQDGANVAWWVPGNVITWSGADPDVSLALAARIVTLATAAAKAMGGL